MITSLCIGCAMGLPMLLRDDSLKFDTAKVALLYEQLPLFRAN